MDLNKTCCSIKISPDGKKTIVTLKDDVLDGPCKVYSINGQLEKEYCYKNGKKHGLYKIYEIDGKTIKKQGNFFENKKVDNWITFDRNDPKKLKITEQYFKNGEGLTKLVKEIFGNGKFIVHEYENDDPVSLKNFKEYISTVLLEEIFYSEEKKHGQYTNNRDEKNKITATYYKGDLHGERVVRDENNNVKEYFMYNQGQKHGICVTFGPGEKQDYTTYDHDKPEGLRRLVEEDGRVIEQINWKSGKMDGKCTTHSGLIRTIADYKDGELNGHLESSYYDEAEKKYTPRLEADYLNGNLHGKNIIYNENGIKTKECEFKEGKLDGKQCIYDEEGVLISETLFKDGKKEGQTKHYYDNGKIDTLTTFHEDKMEGDFEHRKRDGSLLTKAKYKSNKYHGSMEIYNDSQEIQIEKNYKDGLLDGKETVYHSSGKVYSISEYEVGNFKSRKIVNKKP
ncbi:MAG: hypothetical protein LBS83_00510 [Holosporales bacterium]|jgi:antitoxin component YwqK of YwqJK toxin-antitoxin module|nr:hypothetical protein [Holosporales bacterium]